MSEAQRATILEQQQDHWPRAVQAGKQGNPFATLCQHCYGRHPPPLDQICPYTPPHEKGQPKGRGQ